ncbi:MAG: DUF929 family protein [Chloroflexota bacterium]
MSNSNATAKQARKEQQRTLQRQKEIERQRTRTAGRRKRMLTWVVAGIIAAAALAAALVYAINGGSSGATAPAVAATLGSPTSTIPSPPTSGFSRVGAPLHEHGKLELLFIGAQYCPHCAGQRWPIVKALDQFGTFSNLTASSNDDGTIPTFDLLHAGYTSKYVYFDHKDVEDRHHNSLQTLNNSEQTLFNQYDASGGIPLVTVGGYAIVGDGYTLSDVQGHSFKTVQHALQAGNAGQPFVTDINGETNTLTALICHADGMLPASTCGRTPIKKIVAGLH